MEFSDIFSAIGVISFLIFLFKSYPYLLKEDQEDQTNLTCESCNKVFLLYEHPYDSNYCSHVKCRNEDCKKEFLVGDSYAFKDTFKDHTLNVLYCSFTCKVRYLGIGWYIFLSAAEIIGYAIKMLGYAVCGIAGYLAITIILNAGLIPILLLIIIGLLFLLVIKNGRFS